MRKTIYTNIIFINKNLWVNINLFICIRYFYNLKKNPNKPFQFEIGNCLFSIILVQQFEVSCRDIFINYILSTRDLERSQYMTTLSSLQLIIPYHLGLIIIFIPVSSLFFCFNLYIFFCCKLVSACANHFDFSR
jgi:hypothetical protein